MFWNKLAIIVVLVLAWYVHIIGQTADRNTASLGALWARVDSLQTLSEKNLP